MACVSTTLPVPSPSVIVMTMVCESGQVNSARTGTAKVAEPVGHVEHEPVLGGLDVVDVRSLNA